MKSCDNVLYVLLTRNSFCNLCSLYILELTDSQLKDFVKNGEIDIDGHKLSGTDLKVRLELNKRSN